MSRVKRQVRVFDEMDLSQYQYLETRDKWECLMKGRQVESLLSTLQSGRAGQCQCLQWLVVAGWVAARVSRSGWWRLLPQTSKQDSQILSCHAAFLHSNTETTRTTQSSHLSPCWELSRYIGTVTSSQWPFTLQKLSGIKCDCERKI